MKESCKLKQIMYASFWCANHQFAAGHQVSKAAVGFKEQAICAEAFAYPLLLEDEGDAQTGAGAPDNETKTAIRYIYIYIYLV